MADDMDRAQDHIEREEEMRRKYRDLTTATIKATGECLNCFEPLLPGQRWCNSDCREDWELRRK